MANVTVLGLDDFDSFERDRIKEIAERHYTKIERIVKGNLLILHCKKGDKQGNRARYEINAKVEAPEVVLKAKDSDWDLSRTLHKVLVKIEKEAERKFLK